MRAPVGTRGPADSLLFTGNLPRARRSASYEAVWSFYSLAAGQGIPAIRDVLPGEDVRRAGIDGQAQPFRGSGGGSLHGDARQVRHRQGVVALSPSPPGATAAGSHMSAWSATTTALACLSIARPNAAFSQRVSAAVRSATSCACAVGFAKGLAQGSVSLFEPGMLRVTKTTLPSSHITFSTNLASAGNDGSKYLAWLRTSLSSRPSVLPGLAKNRLRTAASSFSGSPLWNSLVFWQSVHSLSPGV